MFKLNSKTILRGIVLFTVLSVSAFSSVVQADVPALLTDAPGVRPTVEKLEPDAVIRSRYVHVNLSVLFDSTWKARDLGGGLPKKIAFNPFPNANFIGEVTRMERILEMTAWTGNLKDHQGSFTVVASKDGLFAHISTPKSEFEVSEVGNGLFKVIEIDLSKLNLVDDAPVKLVKLGSILKNTDLLINADSGLVIDVMVVYTPAARALAGSQFQMKVLIATAIMNANSAYAASGIIPRVRLVHVEELPYTESGNAGLDVGRLTTLGDGYMDTVHNLRNIYGADMVALVEQNLGLTSTGGSICGQASAILATAPTAFAVVRESCLGVQQYSLAHELGHLQGAYHDPAQNAVPPGITPNPAYAQGYIHPSATPTQSFRTMMAYSTGCNVPCPRQNLFSNPTKTYNGVATGVVGVSENYKILNATAFTVANFVSTAVIGSDFNSQFTGSSNGWAAVKGSWSVPSSYYYTAGLSGYSSSSKHLGTYGDITFKVVMYRVGCDLCANRLIIRGNPASLGTTYLWQPAYTFEYSNSGMFSVWRMGSAANGGVTTALKNWTDSPAILKNDWNTLYVVAVGPILKFYINNNLVWSGTDATYRTGSVGIGMYRDTIIAANGLYVDSAILKTAPTAAIAGETPLQPAPVGFQ